jgi:hypothetical protein
MVKTEWCQRATPRYQAALTLPMVRWGLCSFSLLTQRNETDPTSPKYSSSPSVSSLRGGRRRRRLRLVRVELSACTLSLRCPLYFVPFCPSLCRLYHLPNEARLLSHCSARERHRQGRLRRKRVREQIDFAFQASIPQLRPRNSSGGAQRGHQSSYEAEETRATTA